MRSLAKDLVLTENEKEYLKKVSHSKTDESRRVNRAKIILMAYDGHKINDIAQQFDITTTSVTDLLKKALAVGVEASLNDLRRSGAPTKIDFEDISKDELVARIYSYIDIVNQYPVIHKWSYMMDCVELPSK